MPLEPTPAVLRLHPDGDGAEELLLVQLTRFACGSLAVGHTMHHAGQATRGVAFDPVPEHDRASIFLPRDPPRVAFEHRGVEFKQQPAREERPDGRSDVAGGSDDVVVRRVRFGQEFVAELRSRTSAGAPRPYSTLQCVAAHLWRCITAARGLDAHVVTTLCVAVDGRARMRRPPVPDGYAGNVVLWARPAATAGDLLSRPLRFAAELISREVARIDDGYFRSFIDFASSAAVEEERLVPAADAAETAYSPDVEVDSLLHAPFHDLDFGAGPPFFFMPNYLPVEGSVFVVRSFSGDRSVDAYVPLFSRAMDAFSKCCYSLEMADARL
ncbi:hypothetical protein C2845_PMPSC049117 [Panicum miliaceum]|uniref:Agmatine coumaroyltransferase-2-like n=1 Tax=Panicum miliaceum TaxID=4540 RepID=A0A3L6PAY7_PANMI|nr:hypothetical protein C2845_PMPSC049117 [Panicum miliaceum]